MDEVQSLRETETTLTTEFDITEQQIQSVKDDIESVVREIFKQKEITFGSESITLIQQHSLYDMAYILQTAEWPPDDDSPIQADTPEGHFSQYCDEMAGGGQEAYNNIAITLGSLRGHVDRESPVCELTTQIVGENYEQAMQHG